MVKLFRSAVGEAPVLGLPFHLKMANAEHWTDAETRALCEIRIKHNNLFTGSHGNGKKGWNVVIDELGKNGIVRANKEKFKRKWRQQSSMYKRMKEPSNYTTGEGTEDDKETPATWDLYSLFDEFYTSRHTLNPPSIADTSAAGAPDNENAATGKSDFILEDDVPVVPPVSPESDPPTPAPVVASPMPPPVVASPTPPIVGPAPRKVIILKPLRPHVPNTPPIPVAVPSTSSTPIPPITANIPAASTSSTPILPVTAKIPAPSTSSTPIPIKANTPQPAQTPPLRACKNFFPPKETRSARKRPQPKEEADSWFKQYLEESERERQHEHEQFMNVLKSLATPHQKE